eukprot:CAMPEP_0176385066 /NCGR_PEP_ID=MMETSP0126-20121128/34830_1 /TAXON_ID=141414 ORGANISM="Strombidinopsis acuminatum, Strain SPMC142" /NCGR_SAMPLE_ID=MMETSP0126 /ASSEMBLY_ACC=CAM_ASM_000229 /LENGTH=68 /DNA_ID=CAMNT_0017751159 /DNA_START=2851 /DNA_END=3057 /DNA_ORIENTATION=+
MTKSIQENLEKEMQDRIKEKEDELAEAKAQVGQSSQAIQKRDKEHQDAVAQKEKEAEELKAALEEIQT